MWFSHLINRLQAISCKGSQLDHSLYIYYHSYVFLYFLIYVDDIIIAGDDLFSLNHVIHLLQNDFPVKNLGDLNFFFDVEAIRNDYRLYLS